MIGTASFLGIRRSFGKTEFLFLSVEQPHDVLMVADDDEERDEQPSVNAGMRIGEPPQQEWGHRCGD